MSEPWWAGASAAPPPAAPNDGAGAPRAPWMPPPGVEVRGQSQQLGQYVGGAEAQAREAVAAATRQLQDRLQQVQASPQWQQYQQRHGDQPWQGSSQAATQSQRTQGTPRRPPAGAPAQAGVTGPTGAASPAQQPTEPWVVGLGVLGFFLVVGAIAFIAFVASGWIGQWGLASDECVRGGGAWECLVNPGLRTQVLLPVVAMFAAFALARAAGVERKQRRGIGYLYALLGYAVLGLAWVVGAGS